MNTDTIAPIAVITVTPGNQPFDPAEPDAFVALAEALAEVLAVVLGVVFPCVDVLVGALLSVPVVVEMLVTELLDVPTDDELPLDGGALELGVAY